MCCAVQPSSDEMIPFVVTRLATLFALAGMRHDPPVVSQIEQVTMLVATDAPDPPLEKPGERVVSYGLQTAPPHVARALSVDGGNARTGAAGPVVLVLPTWVATEIPKMIAPLARSSATSVESLGGASI